MRYFVYERESDEHFTVEADYAITAPDHRSVTFYRADEEEVAMFMTDKIIGYQAEDTLYRGREQ